METKRLQFFKNLMYLPISIYHPKKPNNCVKCYAPDFASLNQGRDVSLAIYQEKNSKTSKNFVDGE